MAPKKKPISRTMAVADHHVAWSLVRWMKPKVMAETAVAIQKPYFSSSIRKRKPRKVISSQAATLRKKRKALHLGNQVEADVGYPVGTQ